MRPLLALLLVLAVASAAKTTYSLTGQLAEGCSGGSGRGCMCPLRQYNVTGSFSLVEQARGYILDELEIRTADRSRSLRGLAIFHINETDWTETADFVLSFDSDASPVLLSAQLQDAARLPVLTIAEATDTNGCYGHWLSFFAQPRSEDDPNRDPPSRA